jgi:hypothetical protein
LTETGEIFAEKLKISLFFIVRAGDRWIFLSKNNLTTLAIYGWKIKKTQFIHSLQLKKICKFVFIFGK